MSFTQDKLTNINSTQGSVHSPTGDYCYGCDAQCKLGYSYSPFGYHVYPTIGGQVISRYIDANYKHLFTGVVVLGTRTAQQKAYAKLWAGQIARLCDHYKTR